MVHIGEIIHKEVIQQGVTNNDFAERICVSPRTVYKLYKKQSIDTQMLYQICRVLKVDLFKLYSDLL